MGRILLHLSTTTSTRHQSLLTDQVLPPNILCADIRLRKLPGSQHSAVDHGLLPESNLACLTTQLRSVSDPISCDRACAGGAQSAVVHIPPAAAARRTT